MKRTGRARMKWPTPALTRTRWDASPSGHPKHREGEGMRTERRGGQTAETNRTEGKLAACCKPAKLTAARAQISTGAFVLGRALSF